MRVLYGLSLASCDLRDRLRRRDVQPVAQRRVDPERHPVVQPVVDHGRDQRPLARRRRLALDHRRDRERRRTASGSSSGRRRGRPSASCVAERLELLARRAARDVVPRRKSYVAGKRKPSRFVCAPRPKHGTTALRDAARYAGRVEPHALVALLLGDLGDRLRRARPSARRVKPSGKTIRNGFGGGGGAAGGRRRRRLRGRGGRPPTATPTATATTTTRARAGDDPPAADLRAQSRRGCSHSR